MALIQLATATLTNQALSASVPQLLLTYTEPGTRIRNIGIDVFADQIQGNGNYIAFCTQQLAGAGSAYETGARATVAVPSGVTAQQFPTMMLRCFAGSVIRVYLLGLAGDTTTPDIITNVTEEYVATDANGAVTFNNTSIGLSAAAIQAIWDALTAGLTTVGSIGKLLVDSIAAAILFPAGAIAFTYTVTDSVTGLPLDGVQVWFSTDAAGANVVWSGVTDAFGVARDVNLNLPRLNAGTYYVWRQLAGYVFSDPDTEVVS